MEYDIENLCKKSVSPRSIANLCGMNIKQVRDYVKAKRKEYAEEIKQKQRIGKIMCMARVSEAVAEKVYAFCMEAALAK